MARPTLSNPRPKSLSSLLLTLLAFLTVLSSSVQAQDPSCSTGLSRNGACCQAKCGTCGGAGCYQRSLALKTRCCPSGIRNPVHKVPSCSEAGPPCILSANPVSPSPSPLRSDSRCATGVASGRACCRAVCGTCGGTNCGQRSRMHSTRCCIGGILNPSNNVPTCDRALPPCRLNAPTPPSPSPTLSPKPSSSPAPMSFSATDGVWRAANVAPGGKMTPRHEACAVMVDGQVVLIGGRGAKPVNVYNPKTGEWFERSRFNPWKQIHHFQCVAARGSVWIPASWTANFPNEENNDVVYEYVVASDEWKTHPGLPANRARGGSAAVIVGDLIYVIAGNRGGHGEHATSLTWVDAYNIVTKKWIINALPPVPGPGRDHTGAARLRNGDICLVGGRDGGSKNFFRKNIASVYCYSFREKKWNQKADLEEPRAGAMTATTCDGRLMIAGGEGSGQAYKRVDVFDGTTWTRGPDLLEARHGSGLAVADCSCGHMFIPSGSGRQGGRPELSSTEQWIPKGAPMKCAKY